MELFWKAAAAVLIALILALSIGKRDISTVLILAVCCMVGIASKTYLEPVLDLLRQLETIAGLENEYLKVIVKAVGIALVSEIAGCLCADAGNGSMGKTLQILGSVAILYLSIPIIQAFIKLIEEILGNV